MLVKCLPLQLTEVLSLLQKHCGRFGQELSPLTVKTYKADSIPMATWYLKNDCGFINDAC